ncbi:efflux RND transporter periplasmic adaptor subunit [Lutibacter sp. HS1-25]|uniref:efflux RND transporter periplasmic adaptor subunit n=1 Tax=Lutibacter sp. HS1-25 TaxID=2485000 RepID=UPI001013A4F2|nr:efflux RND transporter periplasmic adaptor subunit [Lutibacter sp. HS1-25]RXP44829.1 efflux RND transporter periplasmic adaptor subunit [Lutibacter sp. HS1-25]
MKKTIIFGSIAVALIAVLVWFGMKNSKNPIEYETEIPFKTNIVRKTVATGKVVPLEEAEIKPKVSGIIEEIFVEEGAKVKVGDLIATIRVVPNVQSLNSAQGSVKTAQLRFENTKTLYERNKTLFEKGVISRQEFETAELNFESAKQDLNNSQNNLEIIKKGSASGMGKTANTFVKAEISGTILEIPVRKGTQVIESNTFNAGTTIATIADMTKMIFEGKVDEAEVGKIKDGTVLEVSLGAIEKKKYPAKLNFIAPKGTEENGAVQFKIKGDVTLDDEFYVRAGYSANADIVLEQKDSVLAIKEALLQFDKKTETPYVEVETGDQVFEKRDVELGISDGINVEIISGVTIEDKIKIWNKTSKKEGEEEEDN